MATTSRVGIELHAEAAVVIGGLGAAQPGDAARGGIAVGARPADRLLQLLDDVRRRRQVGIAHAEVDDVGAGVRARRLGAVDLLEHVGRQAADAVELFHGPGSSAGEPIPSTARRRERLYHGVAALPAAGAVARSLGGRPRSARAHRQLVLAAACCSASLERGVRPRRRHVVHGRIGRRRRRPLRGALGQAAQRGRHVVDRRDEQPDSAAASSSAAATATRASIGSVGCIDASPASSTGPSRRRSQPPGVPRPCEIASQFARLRTATAYAR